MDLLRLATAGSVDDGKSTLIGRLLFDSKAVLADQLAHVRERSVDGLDLSLITDGLRAEREQGITIDVAYRSFATPRRRFILADCPGHAQYTRNMVTGASTADVAVVLLDARRGVLEQSKRHAFISALLGQSGAGVDQQQRQVGGGGTRDHVARVLGVAGAVGEDESPPRRRERAVGDVDRDALLALGAQPVGQQRQIEPVDAALLDVRELVGEHGLRVIEQPPDQGRLPVVDAAGGGEAEKVHG